VWIFGDDDIIVPGGLAKIISYLETKDYDLVYVNSHPVKSSYTPIESTICSGPTEISDVTLFVGRVHVFLTFISGNIVNKDRVRASVQTPLSSLVGTSLVQLGWIYTALNVYTRGLYIHEQLVGARFNNTGGYKLIEVFGPNLEQVTTKWLQSEKLRRLVINGTLQRFWPAMLLDYRNSPGNFEKEVSPSEILTPAFKDNLRYWFFVYPIIMMPFDLAKFWMFAVRIVNRTDKALGFVLMK
jgi:abequosyltransferase